MIHFITVHWKSPRWIPVQKKYIADNTDSPFLIWADLFEISEEYDTFFDNVYRTGIVDHATKLNYLAEKVISKHNDEDVLVFIDGDAFPIKEWTKRIIEQLDNYPLIAVQRRENDGDIQPHPCFCVTKIKTWKMISGDWSAGYKWVNNSGENVTDVGGNLLNKLEKHDLSWRPLLRSNNINYHPLWFGIYDNLIYHHGAGFRVMASRQDVKNSAKKKFPKLSKLYHSIKIPNKLKITISNLIPGSSVQITEKAKKSEQKLFQEICSDITFFKQFF